MSETNDFRVTLANNENFNKFRKVIFEALQELGPHPRKPLTVTRAAEIAKISQNTAGKYVDMLAMGGEIEIVENKPRRDLYLPDYSNGNKGEGGPGREE